MDQILFKNITGILFLISYETKLTHCKISINAPIFTLFYVEGRNFKNVGVKSKL